MHQEQTFPAPLISTMVRVDGLHFWPGDLAVAGQDALVKVGLKLLLAGHKLQGDTTGIRNLIFRNAVPRDRELRGLLHQLRRRHRWNSFDITSCTSLAALLDHPEGVILSEQPDLLLLRYARRLHLPGTHEQALERLEACQARVSGQWIPCLHEEPIQRFEVEHFEIPEAPWVRIGVLGRYTAARLNWPRRRPEHEGFRLRRGQPFTSPRERERYF